MNEMTETKFTVDGETALFGSLGRAGEKRKGYDERVTKPSIGEAQRLRRSGLFPVALV